ncbi:hypothetical protein JOC77_003696 [Peribacillus deserti]|uniref:Uncharacterized protein n=1 Tax=Peribacillus deserti TaxID=673318 RepID=A0ABS2QM50_9BACI|nr:hypothetical protein [Peribacillus deserti]MBM7694252.1 hypothetical protein [Peribacillus deserti]
MTFIYNRWKRLYHLLFSNDGGETSTAIAEKSLPDTDAPQEQAYASNMEPHLSGNTVEMNEELERSEVENESPNLEIHDILPLATGGKETMATETSTLIEKFESALDSLQQAKPFAKSMYQTNVFQLATELAGTEDGLHALYENASKYDEAGVFYAGPWEDASKLQPPLVGGSLKLKGVNSIIELLSEMRLLSIAKGDYQHSKLSQEEARSFLNEVLALNLDLLFPPETEAARVESGEHIERAERLFQYLGAELSFNAIADKIVGEIERLTVQRPIMVDRIKSMIEMAKNMVKSDIDEKSKESLIKFEKAITSPTPLSAEFPDIRQYQSKLKEADEEVLEKEAEVFSKSVQATGLVSPFHATFIRFINRAKPDLMPAALDLSETGIASYNANKELIRDIILLSIYPQTCQAIYGLGRMLDRGVLTQEPLIPAIRRLLELDIHPQVRNSLLKPLYRKNGITANGILVAGTVSVLGQPLGVGQGLNPTCQSARAISLWAQHGNGQLLENIARGARDNDIDMTFEGEVIHSSQLEGGVAGGEIHQDLDPVSKVLVPHLDKIYNEMMKKTLLRGEDGHKWVNPEFYGEWIPRGFLNLIDPITGYVSEFDAFVRLFYATHHPDYNEGYELIYPNPVGIYITNVHGNLLGLHAVSIQRIAEDANGEYRIYFYNPNNDSSQNWGQGIEPSVTGNGELEGECSLPFHQFVSRMYAFHYNPYEQGDTYMVEDSIVAEIKGIAQTSWGEAYTWI